MTFVPCLNCGEAMVGRLGYQVMGGKFKYLCCFCTADMRELEHRPPGKLTRGEAEELFDFRNAAKGYNVHKARVEGGPIPRAD